MLSSPARPQANGSLQMTFHYNSHGENVENNYAYDFSKLEVFCPVETKNLWTDLRDSGKFASDIHFLSHLLKLEKLWQSGSVEIIAKAPYVQDQINETNHLHFTEYAQMLMPTGTCSTDKTSPFEDSIYNTSASPLTPSVIDNNADISCEVRSIEDSLSSFHCNQTYTPTQIIQTVMDSKNAEDKEDVILDVKAGGELSISKIPSSDPEILEEHTLSPSSNPPPPPVEVPPESDCVRTLRPRPAKIRAKYKEHGSNSSSSSDDTLPEDLGVYTVEIDVDKQFPSLNIAGEGGGKKEIDDDEDSEMRKRPLRKRLRKIVQASLLMDENDANCEAISIKEEAPKSNPIEDALETETVKDTKERNPHKQRMMKRWSTRRLPAAASAYMKVMRLSGRISPDRKAVSSTNTLTLKAPRSVTGKLHSDFHSNSSNDLKTQQLSELVYCQGSREIKCPLCSNVLPLKKDFVAHLEGHVRVEASNHCPVCELKAETKEDLVHHLQTHAEKTYKCDKCSVRFTNRHRLNVHFFEHLTEEAKDDFRCDICAKPCYSRCYLQRHRRRHTGERPYMCDVCGKVYFEMSTLNTHRRSHTDERFTCDLCGNRYMQKSALNLHMKSAHEGIKEHMCEMCGKAFFDKHHLQKHIRIHTGEKPYQCEFCGKSFTQKVNRDQHRRLHTGEQPYRCEYCLRTFALRAAYTQHIRKHTGVKVSEMKRVQLEKLQQEWSEKHPTITTSRNIGGGSNT